MLSNDMLATLKRLKLPAIADNLDLRVREAEEGELGYVEFLSLLVQDEVVSRESNSFQKRLKTAGVSSRMTFEFFDFDFNAAVIPPQRIRDLATGRFIEEHRNLVLAGPPGIGKTHIAQDLGHEAARRGWDVVVYKTHKLLERLVSDQGSLRRSQLLLKRCLSAGQNGIFTTHIEKENIDVIGCNIITFRFLQDYIKVRFSALKFNDGNVKINIGGESYISNPIKFDSMRIIIDGIAFERVEIAKEELKGITERTKSGGITMYTQQFGFAIKNDSYPYLESYEDNLKLFNALKDAKKVSIGVYTTSGNTIYDKTYNLNDKDIKMIKDWINKVINTFGEPN